MTWDWTKFKPGFEAGITSPQVWCDFLHTSQMGKHYDAKGHRLGLKSREWYEEEVAFRRGRPRGLLYTNPLDKKEAVFRLSKTSKACPGCGTPWSKVRSIIDHDHGTGLIRGLLCQKCNLVLGFARDAPKVLINLAKYLQSPPIRDVIP